MNNSRQIILKNIQAGLQKALLPETMSERPSIDIPGVDGDLSMFVAELEKLSCEVFQAHNYKEAIEFLVACFNKREWKETLIWQSLLDRNSQLKASLEKASVKCITEGEREIIAGIPVGITDCQAAIADTGTIVLQNIAGRPSFVSLLPEIHVVFVDTRAIHANLHAYLGSRENIEEWVSASNNLVFISGPSRTGDIELSLTLGVHGPREMIVIIVEDTFD